MHEYGGNIHFTCFEAQTSVKKQSSFEVFFIKPKVKLSLFANIWLKGRWACHFFLLNRLQSFSALQVMPLSIFSTCLRVWFRFLDHSTEVRKRMVVPEST